MEVAVMTVMAVAAMAVGSMAGLARAVPLSKLQRAYTRPIHSDNLPVSLIRSTVCSLCLILCTVVCVDPPGVAGSADEDASFEHETVIQLLLGAHGVGTHSYTVM